MVIAERRGRGAIVGGRRDEIGGGGGREVRQMLWRFTRVAVCSATEGREGGAAAPSRADAMGAC